MSIRSNSIAREANALEDEFLRAPSALARASRAKTSEDDDALFARALAMSENVERCRACARALDRDGVRTSDGGTYHASCLRCAACASPIGGVFEREFATSAGKVFHRRCFRATQQPTCAVCANVIEADSLGVIRFHTTPFWDEKTCVEHASDGTFACDGCGRFEKRAAGEEYVRLPDDRRLCVRCVSTVVVDQVDAEPLFRDILQFFGSFGLSALGPGTTLPPLYLCTQDVMNNVDETEEWHHGRTSTVRGMCVSHTETIETVYREPTWTNDARDDTRGGSYMNVFGGGFQMVERRIPRSTTQKVTAILVLSCLPRLLCGQILAHECMHMYLRFNSFPTLEPLIEEGLCQLFSLLWVEAQMSKPNITEDDIAFAAFIAESIKTDASAVYGDGARLAIAAYLDVGLVQVLEHVRHARNFPI